MSRDNTPGSVRIQTGEGNEWRYDAIQRAAEYYDCNRSNAVAYACEDIPRLVDAIAEVLSRDDLSLKQRREIAETLSTSAVEFTIDSCVSSKRPDSE